jgi:Ca-activated chloride channel family protein
MKRIALAFLYLGVLSLSAFAQSSGRTRPRVVATPTPAVTEPSPGDDPQVTQPSGRRPPVLIGDNRSRPQTPTATPTPGNEENEVVRVETNLVTMPVSVLDREGRFISGLRQQDFRIFENGVEQKVDYFQSIEQPFTVVLMLDVSPSTEWQIEDIQQAAITFVDQLRSNDRVMVIAFDDDVHILSPPTNNRNQLRNAIRQAQIGDGTSLYEAVDAVITRELAKIQGRKAVVLFTDGVDTTSRRANFQSTISDVEEVDALFYPIRYNTQRDMNSGGGNGGGNGGNDNDDWVGAILSGTWKKKGGGSAGSSSREYETGRRYLEALAQNSGGRKFEADSLSNLDAAFSGIAEELRRQYSLGYYPDKVGQMGERKQIKIRVMRPNVIVRAKTSYIVGQSEKRFAGK